MTLRRGTRLWYAEIGMFGDVNNHWDLHRLVNASSAEVRSLHRDLYRSAADIVLVYLAVPE